MGGLAVRAAGGTVKQQSSRRVLLLTLGPVVAVIIGVITNVLTSHWNWWLFISLTVLVCLAAGVAVALDGNTGWGWLRRKRRGRAHLKALPRDADHFTGRQDEVSRLSTMIEGAGPGGRRIGVFSVEGIGGVGKTSLVVHAARQIAGRYPDGVLYIDLRAHVDGQRPVPADEALAILLSNLGIPGDVIPDSLEGRKSLWRRELAEARVLVILDNASGPEHVRDLLAGGDHCLIIITSRQRMDDLEGVFSIPLETLPTADAIALFGRSLDIDPTGNQGADIAKVVDRIGCLPLAIKLTAARLRRHPTWTIRDLLEETGQNATLERVCALSYADLEPDLKTFFRLLSAHPGAEITAQTAAVLAGTSLRTASESLEELYNRYLLTEPSRRRYKFHDLIKNFAIREGADMDDDLQRREAVLRLLGHYAFMSEWASEKIGMTDLFTVEPTADSAELSPPRDDTSALGWLDAELGNLLACAYYANDEALVPFAWQLPASLTYYLRLRGLLMQAVSLLDIALGTLEREPDRFGEATVRRRAGQLARLQGHSTLSRRQLEKSMQLTEELGDRQGLAWCHHELAHLDRLNGDLTAARDHLTKALDINRDLDNQDGITAAETYLGTVLHKLGQTAQARDYLTDALRLARANTDRRAQAAALYHLGALERDNGDYTVARQMLDQALAIYDEVRNRQGQAECHLNLAAVDRLTGRYEHATQHLQEALGINVELGYRRGEADTYAELAATAEASGKQSLSLVHAQRAKAIDAELKQN